ncbi:MAG: hypothetical protein IJX91_02585 [Clostridia bacterium]|nr:hypothetical protein [Clostridia bacterium]
MKRKNKVLLTSLATIAMSTSLIAGGTYALFTSESSVNLAVTSGKVEVEATASNLQENNLAGWDNIGTATLTDDGAIVIDRMVPNDSFTFDVTITNYSNVAAQYRTVVETTEDNGLADALTVSFEKKEATNGQAKIAFLGGYGVDNWTYLEGVENGTVVETITVTISFESKGNEEDNKYNGDYSCKYQLRVEAVQGNAEVVDPITYENGVYYVNSEDGMRLMNSVINTTSHGEGRSIKFALTADMDMTGIAWTPIHAWWVNVDGQNHTVSNLNCGIDWWGRSGFAGYVGGGVIENITFENVTAEGSQAGIVAGSIEGATLNNVKIAGTNSAKFNQLKNPAETWGGVGAVSGVATAVNTASTVEIVSGATVTVDYNGLITEAPIQNAYSQLTDISAIVTDNGTVTPNGVYYQKIADGIALDPDGNLCVYNANGLQYLSANGLQSVSATYSLRSNVNVVLMNDIDMEGAKFSAMSVPYNGSATFDGNGYTISNINIVSGENDNSTGMASLFYGYEGSTLNVSNLKLENVTVTSDENASGYAGVIVGYAQGTLNISGVEVNNATVNGAKSSGALVGHVTPTAQIVASDCTVTNATVTIVETAEEPDGHYAGQLIGRVAGMVKLEDCSADVEVSGNLHEDNEENSIYGNMVAGGALVEDGEMKAQKLATVTVMTEEELATFNANTEVKIYDTDTEVDLEAAYTFTMAQSYDMALASDYANWLADYYVTIDRDIEEGQLGLAGSYELWQDGTWIAFYAPATEANVATGLMASIDATFTYADVANFVKVFNCGVFDNSGACAGMTMKVELRLTNPEDSSDYIVVNSTEYTFA